MNERKLSIVAASIITASIFVLVGVSYPFVSSGAWNNTGNTSDPGGNPVFPDHLEVYYVGPLDVQSVILGLGVPAANIHSISLTGVQNTPNDSIIFVDWSVFNGNLYLPVRAEEMITGNLFAKGDMIMVQGVNQNMEISKFLGLSWANEFHSKVLVIPPAPVTGGKTLVAANGGPHFLAMAPVNITEQSFLNRVAFWYGPFLDPPVNSDPLEYVESNPPTNGWTFATGETVGLSNANGTYYYDMGMFLEDKLVESYSTGDMKIPLTTMGWEEYVPSSTMTSNYGYIESETSNISYISNYNFYLHGWQEPIYPYSTISYNSYLYSILGTSPSSSQSVTSYSASFAFPTLSASFGITYTPSQGDVSVQYTGIGAQGTPKPEDNYLWSFTYSSTVANNYYANGFSGQGEWLLTAGTGNQNNAAMTMKERVNLVTQEDNYIGACGSGTLEYYYENILLQDHFALTYNPGENWTTSGSSFVCPIGPNYNGEVSAVSYSTSCIYY